MYLNCRIGIIYLTLPRLHFESARVFLLETSGPHGTAPGSKCPAW